MSEAPLLVFIGTKAQYIKTAPILRELDARGLPYQLIYTGQHSETFEALEAAFGVRKADIKLVANFEASTHASFARWVIAFWCAAFARIRSGEWRGSSAGIVHGDTASTLFSTMALRLSGVRVAHVEAGLRSPRLLEPFPEEIVRRLVSRMSWFHFAPDATAVANLAGARGVVINTGGNTLRDALRLALARLPKGAHAGAGGYGVVSIHRSENLSRSRDFDLLMEEVMHAASISSLKFVLHPATREHLRRTHWWARLKTVKDLNLTERMDYPDFIRLLVGASFLMTDGGSNQEEAAMMGLPTLLLRRATERSDGLEDNVTMSSLDREKIRNFVAAYAGSTWVLRFKGGASPSVQIVDALGGAAASRLSNERANG